ncbi:MAG: HAD-IA family hydrolase [Rickettsiales bacterium]|nr:HAD-IA family hydrolase [Rickettsiales bacterium]
MKILVQNIELTKPKLIIFDWDNTLVDSLSLICDSIQDTLIRFNSPPMSERELMEHRRMCAKSFIEKRFHKQNHDEVRKVFIESYKQLAKSNIAFLPKAEKALEEIGKKDIKMAIVSNKAKELLINELKDLGAEKYFLSIVGSGDLKEDKPSPLPVFKALKDIGMEPNQEVWFVGDSATDMAAAHNSQCLPVFFGTDDYTSEAYTNYQPTIHFSNHDEVIRYFSSLKS